jgi:hypothetical protein
MRIDDLRVGDLVRYRFYFRPFPFQVTTIATVQDPDRRGRTARVAVLAPADPRDVPEGVAPWTPNEQRGDGVPRGRGLPTGNVRAAELEPWTPWWELNGRNEVERILATDAAGEIADALAALGISSRPLPATHRRGERWAVVAVRAADAERLQAILLAVPR